jgi:hypothetical protein
VSADRIDHCQVGSVRFRATAAVCRLGRYAILAWLAALIFAELAFAQIPADARYGIVAGVSRHKWTTAPPEDLGPSFTARPDVGGAFGLYVDGLSGRRIGVTIEALVTAAGSAQRRTNGERVDWSYWNIEAPVLARARLLDGRLRPIVVAGLAPGFRLTDLSIVAEDGRREVSEAPPNRFWIGAVVGAGVEMGRLGIHVRYTHGLRQIFVGPPSSPRIHPRAANVLVRLAFR